MMAHCLSALEQYVSMFVRNVDKDLKKGTNIQHVDTDCVDIVLRFSPTW